MGHRIKLFVFFCISINITFAGSLGSTDKNINFSGFYAGLGTGFTNIITNTTYSNNFSQYSSQFDTFSNSKYNNTAVLFAGQIGYGKMFQEKAYLGAKASIYYTPFELITPPRKGGKDITISETSLNSSFTSEASIKPIYNLDLVLGYEVFPRVLSFIEGGVTFGNTKQSFNSARNFTNDTTNESITYNHVLNLDNYVTGYNVGIGANVLAYKNWLFFSELVYNYLGKNAASINITVPFNRSLTENYARTEKNQIVSLLAGVSYFFPV